ncbi:hypothetical protein RSSM_00410 [Rhodopirellula sallentina SM41]|uniref:Uncharacterized protein n=1 Tax=Rhodopirellula sallentina SM41 TaxID=1263870 RepID=M5U9N3_9BACT|nr:hypothetical protein RSSM_00410 [Rhodopirellula sallentina SM41]
MTHETQKRHGGPVMGNRGSGATPSRGRGTAYRVAAGGVEFIAAAMP